MSDYKCTYCDGKIFQVYKYQPVCFDCYGKICHFCSDKADALVLKTACPKAHVITSSTRNRFMDDDVFLKGGGFDLESDD
jgi:hypothetical protein